MPADDHPFDALEHQSALEDASISPIGDAILQITSSIPLPWPIGTAVEKIKAQLGADSLDRIRIMLKTCMDEVRKHDVELQRLREAMLPKRPLNERKSLRNSFLMLHAELKLRSDADVLVLEAAIRHYDLQTTSQSEARNSIAARAWMAVAADQTIAITGDELASIGPKLQSFGLASRIEGFTGDTNSFVILRQGRQFVEYIENSIGK